MVVTGGSLGRTWTGREKLLYLIMYKKNVRKWSLLKKNRIICPAVAVNEQFLPGKSKFFGKLSEKSNLFKNFFEEIEIFRKFT